MIEKNDLRALVALRVMAQLQTEVGTALQTDLVRVWDGSCALQREWERLGCASEYPAGFRHVPQLQLAAKSLRDAGYVMEQGDAKRRPYEVTEKGLGKAISLDDNEWRNWTLADD